MAGPSARNPRQSATSKSKRVGFHVNGFSRMWVLTYVIHSLALRASKNVLVTNVAFLNHVAEKHRPEVESRIPWAAENT
jgi:hypothetical protein